MRRLACALAFGTVLGLTAAPAQAVTYDHTDATGDVRGLEISDDLVDGPENFSPLAQERAADITQLRVRHGKSRLIMRLETVNLTRRSRSIIGPAFLVRTPERRYIVSVDAVSFGDGTVRDKIFFGGRRDRCRGIFTDFDFTGNVSMVSIPRSCLGDPRNVQIKAVMQRVSIEAAGPRRFSAIIALDSAMDDRRFRPVSSTPRIVSGPKAV